MGQEREQALKTYKNLYPRIYSFENLYLAYRAARKGKRKRVAVASFEFDLEGNLLDLQDELYTQTYRPGAHTDFYIYEPKRRLVSAAPFRDRVVHHALCRVIEPIWEPRFVDASYACRLGRGTHQALDRCQAWMRPYAYAFHGDVVKYFPSIDHQILRALPARSIADSQTMGPLDRILDSGAGIQAGDRPAIYFPGDDLFARLRPKGLPIGNLTSQFWANVYLPELDMFVKHQLRCVAYLRYMDDFVLFCDNKAQSRPGRRPSVTFWPPICGWSCTRARARSFLLASASTFVGSVSTPPTAACGAAACVASCAAFAGSVRRTGAAN